MFNHPFRKLAGLIVLYSIVIVGIFVLQFRNESVIMKNIGPLHISLAQTQNQDGSSSLKNSLKVSFKGISFYADEITPAILTLNDYQTIENLTLVSCEQDTPFSYKILFSHDTSITFSVSTAEQQPTLSIYTTLPEDAARLELNFKPESGYSVTDKTKSRLIFSSKGENYALTAKNISDTVIQFTDKSVFAQFSVFDPSLEFSFASINPEHQIALKETYDSNMAEFRRSLIEATVAQFKNPSTLSESEVTAYIAEMISQNKFKQAVAAVPEQFKKSNRRTFLSAPYLNTLKAMKPSLDRHIENLNEMVFNSIANQSLTIFLMEELADYLTIMKSSENAKTLLSIPAAVISAQAQTKDEQKQVTPSEATGVLMTYMRLIALRSNLADILAPVIQDCIKLIESACTLSDTDYTVSINENGTPVSNIIMLKAGSSLIEYGTHFGADDILTAGYAIVNSTMLNNPPDLISSAELYPILVKNNNYPHFENLYHEEGIWAWTSASSVWYTERNGQGTISIAAKKEDSHYVIINGIKPFSKIEIYGVAFHFDPRFESYNSSGYMYQEQNKTLLLKSRHKTETETIRLTYR